MLRWRVWFTSCSLATSLLNSLIQDRARVLTSIRIQAAFIGDEQIDESVTRKKGVEEGLFHVVLGTMDVSFMDGYPHLPEQLTGRKTSKGFGWVPVIEWFVCNICRSWFQIYVKKTLDTWNVGFIKARSDRPSQCFTLKVIVYYLQLVENKGSLILMFILSFDIAEIYNWQIHVRNVQFIFGP